MEDYGHLEFNNYKSSKIINEFISNIRLVSSKINDDRVLYSDIKKVSSYLKKKNKNWFIFLMSWTPFYFEF